LRRPVARSWGGRSLQSAGIDGHPTGKFAAGPGRCAGHRAAGAAQVRARLADIHDEPLNGVAPSRCLKLSLGPRPRPRNCPTPMKTTAWNPRDVDTWSLLFLIGNAVAVGLLGRAMSPGMATLAWQVAGGIAAGGTVLALWWRGTPASGLVLGGGLAALVLLQLHFAAGSPLPYLNALVTLGLLMPYRDARPIALATTLFLLHAAALGQGFTLGLPPAWAASAPAASVAAVAAALLVQGLMLGAVARQRGLEGREARELEFLVNAMGREGKIRLNLDVVRAETPAGQRLQHVQQRMATAMAEVHAAFERIERAAADVASGSRELSSRTAHASAGLKDSAMCLDQIGVIVQHSTEASNEARAMSVTASEMADEGGRLVGDVVRTMQEIEGSSRRITDIIAGHRRHRLPDQHPGAQCRCRSGARRRPGPGLRRRGQRSAHPGPAQRHRGSSEIKSLIGSLGHDGGDRHAAGGRRGPGDERAGRVGAPRGRAVRVGHGRHLRADAGPADGGAVDRRAEPGHRAERARWPSAPRPRPPTCASRPRAWPRCWAPSTWAACPAGSGRGGAGARRPGPCRWGTLPPPRPSGRCRGGRARPLLPLPLPAAACPGRGGGLARTPSPAPSSSSSASPVRRAAPPPWPLRCGRPEALPRPLLRRTDARRRPRSRAAPSVRGGGPGNGRSRPAGRDAASSCTRCSRSAPMPCCRWMCKAM
jgi:hypothetical protein